MAKLFLLLPLLLLPLAFAFTPQDYLNGSQAIRNVSVNGAHFVVGSGNAFFFDGDIVTDEQKIAFLSTKTIAGNASALKEKIVALVNLTSNCVVAYDDFAVGRSGVCYDDSFKRYRCDYLWDQGFWIGIIPFNISEARRVVESSLPKMAALAASASAQQLSSAQSIDSAKSLLQEYDSLAKNFSFWNGKMRSYLPFNRDAKLYRCALNASDADAALQEAVAESILSTSERVKQAALEAARQAHALNPAKAFSDEALAAFSSYEKKAVETNASFTAVSGEALLFVQADLVELRAAAKKVESSDSFVSFNATLAKALSRIVLVEKAIPAYADASLQVQLARNSSTNSSAVEELRRRFVRLELDAALGAPDAKAFQQLSSEAKPLQAQKQTFGAIEIAAAIAIAALVLAAIVLLNKRRQK